jgi:hypothetical protein
MGKETRVSSYTLTTKDWEDDNSEAIDDVIVYEQNERRSSFEEALLQELDEDTIEEYAKYNLDLIEEDDFECKRTHLDEADDEELLSSMRQTKNIVEKIQMEELIELFESKSTIEQAEILSMLKKELA